MIWNFWFVIIGYIMLFAYYIDFFRRKGYNSAIIIKRPTLNRILSTLGFLLVLVGYAGLFWVYKWWVATLLIVTIPLQNLILVPLATWIKVKIYKDQY